MRKSNLFSLVFIGALATGVPYAVLNHDVAYAAEEEVTVTLETKNINSTEPVVKELKGKETGLVEEKETSSNILEESKKVEVQSVEKIEGKENQIQLRTILTEAASVSDTKNLDIKNLKDGEYEFGVNLTNFYTNGNSMADAAVSHTAKLTVRDGKYYASLDFKPITQGAFTGYLGNLKYYYGEKSGGKHADEINDIQDNEFIQGTIKEYYPEDKKDNFFDKYKENYPTRLAYPKVIEYQIDPKKIDDKNKLKTYAQVYVPVMDTFGVGIQRVNVTYDFSSLKVIKLKEERPTVRDTKYVEITVKDDTITTPKVRKNVDKVARLVKEGNEEYLILTYLSQNGKARNNDGLQNIRYAYSADSMSKITPNVTVVDKVILRDGETDNIYEVSEAKIKVTGQKSVVVFGDFQYPARVMEQYGTITWEENSNLVKENKLVDMPKLFSVKPVLRGIVEKKGGEKQAFDFISGGVTYSPYNGLNGDKFKLADNYYFNLEFNFSRESFFNTKTRHVKYTIDGSEPTFSSNDATLGFANQDKFKPEFSYRITVNPFDKTAKLDKNNVLTFNVKAFNNDGTQSSETITYKLPFDKVTIDEINEKATIDNKEYDAKLSSGRKFYLDNNATFKVSSISEVALVNSLNNKVSELGLKDAVMLKVDILNKDNSRFTPLVKRGWNVDENPIFKLSLSNFTADKNTFVYIYENGNLRLVPSTVTKGIEFNVNSDEAYFVIAKKDATKVITEEIDTLRKKVEEVKKVLKETTSVSTAKANLETELAKVEKTLKRANPALNSVILHLETIDKNLKTLNSEKTVDLTYLQKNAKEFSKIVESNVLKEVLSEKYLTKINELKEKVNSSLNNMEELSKNLKNLQGALDTLEYKYPTQDIEFKIKKYYNPDDVSMANNVFVNKGKLIFTPTKTYLDIDLKTMLFGSLHAHLLELDIFKDKLDGEKLPYFVVNKYDDINSLNGEIANFDKKLLVALEKNVKETYDVRVANDGMGGSRPEAKLVISTKVERPEIPNDEETRKEEEIRREKERLEKEKAKREAAEKFVKENLDKIKEQAVAKSPKERELINNATNKDVLTTIVEGKVVVVALDNTRIKADKLSVKSLTKEDEKNVVNLVSSKLVNSEVITSYDISLLNKEGKVIENDKETRAVTIAVVKEKDEILNVYYVKGDTLELVPSIYQNGRLTFFTSHFSTYTIVKSKVERSREQEQKNNSSSGDKQKDKGKDSYSEIKEINTKKGNQLPKTSATKTTVLGLFSIFMVTVLGRKKLKNKC